MTLESPFLLTVAVLLALSPQNTPRPDEVTHRPRFYSESLGQRVLYCVDVKRGSGGMRRYQP